MATLRRRASALVAHGAAGLLLVPIALFGLAAMAYAIGIRGAGRLGFFWDDWIQVLVNVTGGAGAVRHALAFDRPGLGLLATATDPLIGSDATRAFAFGLAMHWLAAVALFWLLALVWPDRRREGFLVAALFLVYPGFSQQYVSLTYGRIFLALALGLLSFCLMIRAQRSRARLVLTGVAVVLGGAAAVVEYFVALELLRPAVLWKVLPTGSPAESRRSRARAVMRAWLPYAGMLVAFVGWRLLFFDSGRAETDSTQILSRLVDSPLAELRRTFVGAVTDLVEVTVLAFGRALDPGALTGTDRVILPGVVLGLVAAVTVVLVARLLTGRGGHVHDGDHDDGHEDDGHEGDGDERVDGGDGGHDHDGGDGGDGDDDHRDDHHDGHDGDERGDGDGGGRELTTASRGWARTAMLAGAAALVLGGIPQWFAGQFVGLAGDPRAVPIGNDRFTVAMSLGGCLLVVGFVSWTASRPRVVAGVVAALVALSVAYQYRNGDVYQQNLQTQAQLDWQLSWRVPALAPGTILVFDRLDFSEDGADDSVAAPLLLAYDPGNTDRNLPFWVQSGINLRPLVAEPSKPVFVDARGVRFLGRFDDRVVLSFRPPSCLRVLRGRGDYQLPGATSLELALAAGSRPARVVATSSSQVGPSSPTWGPEVGHGWCWYFQRMELARQVGDTAQYARMADEARARQLLPGDPDEWLDVIEAYVLTGRPADARAVVDIAREASASPDGLCGLRRHLAAKTPPATLDRVFGPTGCPSET